MLSSDQQHEADRIAARFEKRIMSYQYKKSKDDRALHDATRDLWVRMCDLAGRLLLRLDRLVHPHAVRGRR